MLLIEIPNNKLICPNCKEILIDLRCPNGCSTKIQSLRQTQISGTAATQRERIYYLLLMTGKSLSRNEISKVFDYWENRPRIRLSAVCGRVNELLRDGLIEVAGNTWDTETKRNVEIIRALPIDKQLVLF